MRSYNPPVQAPGFGLFRFRSPLLSESRLISLPPGTEMVHFPGLARTRLYIQRAVSQVHWDGFPHSEIPGSKPACGSPRLIAACHVLLRLLAPRHPPYALSSLTIKLTQHVAAGNAGFPRAPPVIMPVESPFSTYALFAKFAVYATSSQKQTLWRMPTSFSFQRTIFPAPGGG
jgi:hypothetical protein